MTYRCVTALFALLAISTPSLLHADHVEETIEKLTGLNRALLEVLSENGKASASGKAQLSSRAAALIANRGALLEGLIAEHADAADKLAFPADLLGSLAAAFPESADKLEERGAWQGTVEIVVETDDNFSIRKMLLRLLVGSEVLDLHFTELAPEGLMSGDILTVQGVRAGSQVAAADSETQGAIAEGSTCSLKTGDQKIAVLKITFPGVAFPSDVTRQLLHDTFFATTSPSVNTYWQEVSAGLASATAASGDVFPLDDSVYQLSSDDGPYGCSVNSGDYNTIRDAALTQATNDPDFNLASYDRIFFIHPSPGGSCWYGLGSLGCWSSGGWGTNSYAWQHTNAMDAPNRVEGVRVSAHEGGHNLGVHHSSSRDFGTETLGAPAVQGTLSEYGDYYSMMGSSSGHYPMTQKLQLGWASLDSGIHQLQTVQSSGTFTIKPAEDLVGGLKALKVKRGTDTSNSNWLYISYRQNGGDYDTTTTSAGHNNGALIHYEDSLTRSLGRTHLIDFTVANGWTDVALASGAVWSDTYSNLSITVGAATATSLDVTIDYGAIACIELAPTLSLSPSSQSAFAGGSAEMTATVTNNDGSGCSASTFTLTPSVPAGWGYTVSPASLTLSSAQTTTATFTVNPPEGTSPATYTASLTANHPIATLNGSDSASIHVVAPLTDIAITSVSGPANAEVGGSVNVNVTVQNVGNQDVISNIDVTLADTTDGPAVGTQTIAGGLAPGASTTLTFVWNTSGASSPANHTLSASHNFSDENSSNDSGSTVVTLNDPLSIANFSPAVIQRGSTVPVSITGTGFLAGAAVQFVNGSGPSPSASNVVVTDPNTITAMVSAPSGGGKSDRQWDARVSNSGGASVTLAGAVTLSSNPPPNTAPTAAISSPASGSSFAEGTSVSFAGTANDAEDGDLTANLSWTSSIDGAIGSGGSFSYTLSGGSHTITASVTDAGGATGSDSVSVTITVSNNAPSVSISSPGGGSTFSTSDTISFAGAASDVEDGDVTAGISWTSSINGAIGSGAGFSTSSLSEGSHTITASVTDSGGKTGSATVSITVTAPGSILLTGNGYKVKGRHNIDLSWSGAAGSNVEIHRDGALLTTTANDGAYTDAAGNRGSRTYVYQVCETGGGACSNTATVIF